MKDADTHGAAADDEDATTVATVRAAGAIVFGKTNIPRWSGDYQSYNDIFGTTSNPFDGVRRTPSTEIGTDIVIYGHKPSFGVIPTHGYLDSVRFHRNTADVNVFGPLARSIDDLDLLFDLLAHDRLARPPSRATELTQPSPRHRWLTRFEGSDRSRTRISSPLRWTPTT